MTSQQHRTATTEPLAVADDLSAFVTSGMVTAERINTKYETDGRTVAQGIDDAVDAERIGFRRVWLSERYDIKLADVILSGMAARTSRLEFGSGLLAAPSRHVWLTAALGATMQACYGPRFVLGLGRGDNRYFAGSGIVEASFEYMADYIDILRRLWAGERVTYQGPVGKLDDLSLAQTYPGPPPPIFVGGLGLAKSAKLIAERCDGVLLAAMLTPDAVHDAVTRIRRACEQVGRDPATIRIVALVVTAPDLDEVETRTLTHGRAVTYLGFPGYGDTHARVCGWGDVARDVQSHPLLRALSAVPDRAGVQRHELLEVASVIPDKFMAECSAIGTVDECVRSLQRFVDAGADEVATYGSTPAQNAGLVEAWRRGKATAH